MTAETSDLNHVLARLGRLERQNRWLKRGGLLALLLAGVGLLAGAAQKKERTVEAEKFLLRDANGKERASLAMTAEGPTFQLLDEANRPRAQISVNKNVPSFKLLDETGKIRTQATIAAEGPEIRLADQDGKPRVFVGVLKFGPCIRFLGGGGKIRAALNGFAQPFGPSLNLFEADKLRAHLTLTNEGPLLGLGDANGKRRAALSVTKEGPRLKLLDAGEQILFSRP